jgi:DNA polymerase III subunit beta
MRITIRRDDISEVLSRIQGLTGKKTSLAITENVLIKTIENGITLSATDLETGFEGKYAAEVHDPGEIAINARKITEIVKNFPVDEISIQELENRWIEISSPSVEYHIVGMDPENFPHIPKVDNVDFIAVDSSALRKMIEKSVAIAVSGNEKKAYMLGALLAFKNGDGQGIVRMVSTDLKRLSKVDFLCAPETRFKNREDIIVPKKGLSEVYKFLENEGNVEIGIKENHFIVKKENEYAIVNILDGGFPPYESLFETDPEYDIVFDRSRLLMMLKRMAILTSEDYKGVVFHLNNDEFTIRTVNAILGESKETMEIAYEGTPREIAFNPRFFLEAINFISHENVILNIRDDQTPCIVRGEQDSTYINVIMPMKI